MKINTQFTKFNIRAILPYLIFALIVLAIKLLIIANYGNATPFWDQWGAEANRLYRPLLEGNLTWVDMLAAHNNHRILTTRLLNIVLFYINGGVWNPILQMQVNAVIHVFALILLIFYVAKALTPAYRNALLLFCTVIFSIPFGWQNVLEGFQSSFYFLLLFNIIFLWTMVNYKTYSLKWWLGTIAGVLSFMSLASGVVTLVVGAIISIFRRYINKEKSDINISAILILIIIAILAIVLTPTTLPHLKAKSITQLLFVFANIYSWPVYSMAIGMLITQTPILFLIFNIVNKNEYRTVTLLFLMAIALWLFGQFAIIAYGRAVGFDASRYTDLFAVGIVINFSAIAILLDKEHFKKKLVYHVFGILWVVIILISFIQSKNTLSQNIINKSIRSQAEEQHVRAYLCSGNFSDLKNKRIPYPNIILLKKFLDNSTIRSFLPGNIYGPNSSNPKTFCNEYANEKPF